VTPAEDLYVQQIGHALGRAIEIAALKGVQGARGLPF
jgi:hypothetical protein